MKTILLAVAVLISATTIQAQTKAWDLAAPATGNDETQGQGIGNDSIGETGSLSGPAPYSGATVSLNDGSYVLGRIGRVCDVRCCPSL